MVIGSFENEISVVIDSDGFAFRHLLGRDNADMLSESR
jgi:hypothetical protein